MAETLMQCHHQNVLKRKCAKMPTVLIERDETATPTTATRTTSIATTITTATSLSNRMCFCCRYGNWFIDLSHRYVFSRIQIVN